MGLVEMTRRQFLLWAGTFGAIDRLSMPAPALTFEAGTSRDAARKGRRFLATLFDPALDLLPEYRGSQVYWLYHDNYLAAKVLDRTEPEMARKIREAIRRLGITGSGKIEILFGEAGEPLPFRHHRLEDVERVGEKLVRTEVVGDQVLLDWTGYADLLFLAAIAEAGRDQEAALRHLEGGLATWDGLGFQDRASRTSGLYATYKLALALIAARLGREVPIRDRLRDRLLGLQRRDGGFVTDYDAGGRPVGEANVETTSLAVLALDGAQ
jgi:hypothetical protein